MWKQIEATPPHLTYLILSVFLLTYACFSVFIRNRLHLSEPPLALLTGIIFGPKGANALDPRKWGIEDDLTQEFTRIIVGLQVLTVGLELPRSFFRRHWASVLWLLGPAMAFGWIVCAAFIYILFHTDIPTALTISACLTPTDPVLAASVLSNSRFSNRIPKRIKNLLSCESGCNDGVSFPFLYVGLSIVTESSAAAAVKEWFLVTILWQCSLGILVGAIIGIVAHWMLKFACERKFIGRSAFVVFYLLLAVLSVGVASTLGLDDFLVAFSCGAAFANDGWFAVRTKESNLNNVLDLLLNSTFFVYFGTILPWDEFSRTEFTPTLTTGKLVGLLVLVLVFRRIPILLACKDFIPDIRTWGEAIFCGHFGPMGVGALFLAIEARAQLETGTSLPLPRPDPEGKNIKAVMLIWPVVSFIVLGSTLVHGLSVAATSIAAHYTTSKDKRAAIPGSESEPLNGMNHEETDDDSEETGEDDNDRGDEGRRRLVLQ